VERVQAAEEGAAGDDAAEGGAGRAGAAQVLERGEADEDLREDVVGEGQVHRGRRGVWIFFLEEMGYGFWRERERERERR